MWPRSGLTLTLRLGRLWLSDAKFDRDLCQFSRLKLELGVYLNVLDSKHVPRLKAPDTYVC